MFKLNRKWQIALGISLALHVMIIAIFSVKSTKRPLQPMAKMRQNQPVKAVSIDSAQLQSAINQVKATRQAQIDKTRALETKARQAERKRANEAAALAKLKAQANVVKSQTAREKAKANAELEKVKNQAKAKQRDIAQLNAKARETQAKTAAAQEKAKAAERAVQQAKAKARALEKAKQVEQARLAEAKRESEIMRYTNLIRAAIANQWVIPDTSDKQATALLLVELSPTGDVLEVQLSQASGDALLDRSAIKAVYKASPLPVPADEALFAKFKTLRLTVRPEGIVN